MSEKSQEVQVNTLIYSMGDDADDILRSLGLTNAQMKEYDTVKGKFETNFVKRRNVIFERAKFNMRKQEESEPVDAFITDLYMLAKHYSYGNLHDEMVRDCLVVGLRNTKLSEKLQLDADLTLDKAVTEVRQAETVKKQQRAIRSKEDSLPFRNVHRAPSTKTTFPKWKLRAPPSDAMCS